MANCTSSSYRNCGRRQRLRGGRSTGDLEGVRFLSVAICRTLLPTRFCLGLNLERTIASPSRLRHRAAFARPLSLAAHYWGCRVARSLTLWYHPIALPERETMWPQAGCWKRHTGIDRQQRVLRRRAASIYAAANRIKPQFSEPLALKCENMDGTLCGFTQSSSLR